MYTMTNAPNDQLKHERLLRGWSQKVVASRIGTDEGTVGRWELGKKKPSPYYRQKLCELFEKNAEELRLIDSSKVSSSKEVAAPENQRGTAKQDSISERPSSTASSPSVTSPPSSQFEQPKTEQSDAPFPNPSTLDPETANRQSEVTEPENP